MTKATFAGKAAEDEHRVFFAAEAFILGIA
jgi:hypothetical protein